MIILGIVCIVLGVLLGVWVLYVLGIVALVLGVALYAASFMGHAVGGRRGYY